MSELDVDDLETIEAIDSILDVINNNLPKVSLPLTADRNSHCTCNRLMLVYSYITDLYTDDLSTYNSYTKIIRVDTTYD